MIANYFYMYKICKNSFTEHITRMWEKSLKVYTTEEQGLKLMLAQNASEDVAKSDKKIRVLQEWDRVLFGPKIVPGPAYWGLTSAEKNFDTFVAIRYKLYYLLHLM